MPHSGQRALFRILYGFAKQLPPSYFWPFPFGQRLRRFFAGGFLESVDKSANIESGAHFSQGGIGVRIGANSGVGVRAQIAPFVTIGNDVMMGPDVLILTQNHEISRTDIPMRKQGYSESRPVIIEDDVWIGARAVILPGVTIGKGCLIGAAAVVTKSVPPYSVFVGNPGRVVRSRLAQNE